MSKPVSVRFDDATLAELRAYAKRLDVSPSVAMRYLVRLGLGHEVDETAFAEGFTSGAAAFRRALSQAAREVGDR